MSRSKESQADRPEAGLQCDVTEFDSVARTEEVARDRTGPYEGPLLPDFSETAN